MAIHFAIWGKITDVAGRPTTAWTQDRTANPSRPARRQTPTHPTT
ncbi:hypothetical protein FHS32_004952 [Streptomyces albaduncus]|uniref:Uncharacterized protein n=1 Tax=Streptomyces griseoloalbus TaxID=67303 RepID=A0A7W8FAH3_9ACTN|nr:hypothetical protein [Streptomyces albaduncus]